MARSKLVALLFEAWKDFDRAVAGLDRNDAVARPDGGSSFAWTAAHLANQVDTWINVRFQGREPHPLIGRERFRFGGSGAADEWEAVQAAVLDVRRAARTHLDGLEEAALERVIPYDGSFARLRETGMNLRYALYRAIAHHYFHLGEVASKRVAMGHNVGDYPGLLEEAL